MCPDRERDARLVVLQLVVGARLRCVMAGGFRVYRTTSRLIPWWVGRHDSGARLQACGETSLEVASVVKSQSLQVGQLRGS